MFFSPPLPQGEEGGGKKGLGFLTKKEVSMLKYLWRSRRVYAHPDKSVGKVKGRVYQLSAFDFCIIAGGRKYGVPFVWASGIQCEGEGGIGYGSICQDSVY